MTNLKISSKMHVFIIISAILVAIGVAVGVICHFVAGGYFNAGDDYKNYKAVEVSYEFVDFSDEKVVKEICDDAFSSAGIKYYAGIKGNDAFEYRFSASVSEEKIFSAVEKINTCFKTGGWSSDITADDVSGNSYARYHVVEAEFTSESAFVYGAIAVASAFVFQFIYFAIRYKLTMAFSALLANVHNLAVFVSLITICRIPVASDVVVFAVITVLLTMIGCGYFFDKYRKGLKDESFAKQTPETQSDECAGQTLLIQTLVPVGVAAVAVALFALLSISAMSVVSVIASVACALVAAVSALYGTLFFTPSVYPKLKRIGDKIKAKRADKPSAK